MASLLYVVVGRRPDDGSHEALGFIKQEHRHRLKIDDSVDKPYYDRMHQRLQTVTREKIRQLRGSTVEPVLGTLVNYLGMRRVNTRGLQQANKCMLMAAVAYNLKKLLRWQGKKANSAIKALQKPLEKAFLKLTGIIRCHSSLCKLTVPVNLNCFSLA